MKRLFFALSFVLAGLVCANALSFVTSDVASEQLKGKVKNVKQYDVRKALYFETDTLEKYKRLNMPLPEYERNLFYIAEYNENGMITCLEYRNFDKTVRKYNSGNKKNLMWSEEDRYDSNGALSRHYVQTFDAEEFPLTGLATDEAGDTIFIETFSKTLLPDGNIKLDNFHVSAEGDIQTNYIEMTPDWIMKKLLISGMRGTKEITLDEKERPIRMTEKINDNVSDIIVEYNTDNNKAFKVLPSGEKQLLKSVDLDKFGNPVEEIVYDGDNNVVFINSITYTYDSNGNWTKKRKVRKGQESSPTDEEEIIEREIEYY